MREIRQKEAVDSYTGDYWALIKAAPRFGKIKVTIDIFKKLDIKIAVICIPRVDIKESWQNDFKKWGWDGEAIFTTHRSMDIIVGAIGKQADIIVIDEIHECSLNQLTKIKKMEVKRILSLSGTISNKTEKEISNLADITVCYEYSIEQAVKEGILCDYVIHIHKVPLDNRSPIYGKRTELKKFRALEIAISKLALAKKDTFFLYLQQIQIIQNSLAKMVKTKALIKANEDKRVLVFCGTTKVADSLGYPVYHSKNKEKGILSDFCKGKGKHLVTIKMAQSGLTIDPINLGVINYISGNPEDTAQKICRFLGYEYNNPGKKAELHFVSTDEKFELQRVLTALMFFDEKKIIY